MNITRRARAKPKAERFVQRVMDGDNQMQAFRAVTPRARKLSDKAVIEMASRYANRPEVKAMLKAALASVRPENLVSPSEHLKLLISRAELSIGKDNMTAAAAYDRMVGQGIGLLKDTQVVVNEYKTDDEALLRALAGDDPHKLAAARVLLGESGFKSDTIGPDRPGLGTKH